MAACVEGTGSHGVLYYWRVTVLLTSFRTRCKWCLPKIPWCLLFLLPSGLVALELRVNLCIFWGMKVLFSFSIICNIMGHLPPSNMLIQLQTMVLDIIHIWCQSHVNFQDTQVTQSAYNFHIQVHRYAFAYYPSILSMMATYSQFNYDKHSQVSVFTLTQIQQCFHKPS